MQAGRLAVRLNLPVTGDEEPVLGTQAQVEVELRADPGGAHRGLRLALGLDPVGVHVDLVTALAEVRRRRGQAEEEAAQEAEDVDCLHLEDCLGIVWGSCRFCSCPARGCSCGVARVLEDSCLPGRSPRGELWLSFTVDGVEVYTRIWQGEYVVWWIDGKVCRWKGGLVAK